MWRSRVIFIGLVFLVFSSNHSAMAGMPGVSLTDAGRLRIDTLSFFLMIFVLSAWILKGVWNGLGRQLTVLPPINFRTSCGLVFLWGMLAVIVLTMISGARELMTPGAWEKHGLTYRLTDSHIQTKAADWEQQVLSERRERLMLLGMSLRSFAALNQGRLPNATQATPSLIDTNTSKMSTELEILTGDLIYLPRQSAVSYCYVVNRTLADADRIVIYEPGFYPDSTLGIQINGVIRQLSTEELEQLAAAETTVWHKPLLDRKSAANFSLDASLDEEAAK